MAPAEKPPAVDKEFNHDQPVVLKEVDGDLVCNIFGWKPQWLQIFNNMKVFMFCYVWLGIFRGISFSYFSAMLPSIEKRFGFTSESIGTVKAMNDVSHLISALIIAHFGGAGHRPRWIAGGSLLVGLGFLMMASPEVFFPPSQIASLAAVMSTASDANEPMCSSRRNGSALEALDCSKPSATHIGPLAVLGAAEFVIGLGSTAAMILGMPFVDDNVANKNSPLYFAISFAGFIFGPVIGIALSAYFNTIYFDFSHPDFKPSDPRWISAWYVGFIISGFGTILFGLIISCFPSAIRRPKPKFKLHAGLTGSGAMEPTDIKLQEKRVSLVAGQAPKEGEAYKPKSVTLKDLPVNLKRLFSNYTYMIKLFGKVVGAFALSGYMSFFQKFLKEQYHLPQSTTNLAGGLPPIFAGFLGIGIGSVIIRRFKMTPCQICLLMAFTSLVASACYFSAIGMGCDKDPITGIDDVADPYNLTTEALCVNSHHCNCIDFQFSPICDHDTGRTYVSACVAGCRGATRKNGTKNYYDCLCTGLNATGYSGPPKNRFGFRPRRIYVNNHTERSSVRGGVCPKYCPNFLNYVIVMTIAKFFMGIPTSGVFMIQFRIVDFDLKSLANGLTTVVMSAVGMLPAPIIMGKVIDSACSLWQTNSCGDKGACWIYDIDVFRWKLHVLVGTARLVACVVELIIAYRVRNLSFDRNADKKTDSVAVTSSQMNLVPEEDNDDFPPEVQRSEVVAEARRRSIFIHDAAA